MIPCPVLTVASWPAYRYTCVSNTKLGKYSILLFFFFYFTILYWFCHTSTWIHHGCICVPHPESSSHIPVPSLWVIPVHQPQVSCILHRTWTGDSFLIWYYTCFNAILSNHPILSLSHRVQRCYIHLRLFSCFAYRVIITIFLNSIYMR